MYSACMAFGTRDQWTMILLYIVLDCCPDVGVLHSFLSNMGNWRFKFLKSLFVLASIL
jgi:hypothetical protein